jgi:hypothetical protein
MHMDGGYQHSAGFTPRGKRLILASSPKRGTEPVEREAGASLARPAIFVAV